MKNLLLCVILLILLPSAKTATRLSASLSSLKPAENLIIITIDGYRWQELFMGADPELINDPEITQDTSGIKMLYWSENEKERRQKLMPFFWNVIAKKGQIYGNRNLDNKVNTANIYNFSYPGYNELLTGNTDLLVSSNKKVANRNISVLEYLNEKPAYKGKVVAFTSWEVFPFILNEQRSGMMVNSGYELMEGNISLNQQLINEIQNTAINQKSGTRYDQLTILTAKEYLSKEQPKLVFIGLGETDEYAHAGRYDLYLEQANKIDRMIADLWHWIQTTPGYKDNTNILITTDHGRGSRDTRWTSHSSFIKGSSQTWIALLGPGIEPLGEMNQRQQIYQHEIAGMIARLAGESFTSEIALND